MPARFFARLRRLRRPQIGHRRPRHQPTPKRRHDRAQSTPLVAIALLLAGLLLIPTGLVIRAVHERARAQTAADATALAGALVDRNEAVIVAAANGARIERYEEQGDTVEVVVTVGGRRATARAVRERVRVAVPAGSGQGQTGRDPADRDPAG